MNFIGMSDCVKSQSCSMSARSASLKAAIVALKLAVPAVCLVRNSSIVTAFFGSADFSTTARYGKAGFQK